MLAFVVEKYYLPCAGCFGQSWDKETVNENNLKRHLIFLGHVMRKAFENLCITGRTEGI